MNSPDSTMNRAAPLETPVQADSTLGEADVHKLQDALTRLKSLDFARLQEELGNFNAEGFLVDAPVCKSQCACSS